MTREEQRIIRELKKQIPIEMRARRKEFDLQYAHGFLYRFEGDFLYYATVSVPSNRLGVVTLTTFIKPWILNELYWEMQQMDMAEMRAQPKSFHLRGAFTINDIFYQSDHFAYEENDFPSAVEAALVSFHTAIEEHKTQLTDVQSLLIAEGYRISNLTKSIALIYGHNNERALHLLSQDETVKDVYNHVRLVANGGRSSREDAIAFCKEKQRQ